MMDYLVFTLDAHIDPVACVLEATWAECMYTLHCLLNIINRRFGGLTAEQWGIVLLEAVRMDFDLAVEVVVNAIQASLVVCTMSCMCPCAPCA